MHNNKGKVKRILNLIRMERKVKKNKNKKDLGSTPSPIIC